MAAKEGPKDLEQVLAKCKRGWEELVEVLVAHQTEAKPSPPPNVAQASEKPAAASPETPEPSSPIAGPDKMKPAALLNPLETEAIFQRVERMHRDTEVMERLSKVEKQNRKIMVLGSMIFTIFILTVSAFAFLMVKTGLLEKAGMFQSTQKIAETEPPATVAQAPKPSTPAAETAAVPPPAKATTVSPPAETAAAPPPAGEAVTEYKFVGSKTSNKYHYPDCKYAKTIHPKKLITFKSVEEARKAGYIPCPACKAPDKD